MRKRNWTKYNQDLVKRGSITFFIDEEVLNQIPNKKSRGRPRLFSHPLIQLLIVLKIQYRLSYRALEGFSKSVLPLLHARIALPTYSLICKRASKLEALLPRLSSKRPKVVLIDASGVKVYGEGEWKVKVHGAAKRRQWIKLHIAVDANTQEIVQLIVSHGHAADCKVGKELIKALPKSAKTIIGDGGYDTKQCREKIAKYGAKELIPPRKNARLTKGLKRRNDAIAEIKGLGGDSTARELWGLLTGYSKRALVETTFSRLKRLYGDRFYSRKMKTQELEGAIKCRMLNKMLSSTT